MSTPEKPFDKDLFFRALADHTRLRLLNLMRSEEVCVCFFVEVLKTHQPKISRRLALPPEGRYRGCAKGAVDALPHRGTF